MRLKPGNAVVYPARGLVTIRDFLEIVAAIRDDPCFDHRKWSIWDALQLEHVARRIRDGYAVDESGRRPVEF